jgi:hypothetical protein
MQDAADDPPVVCPLFAPHVGWQVRLDPPPLMVV